MKPTHARLIELVAGRLNHNYISPLTAISNAVNLIQLAQDNSDAALNIIEESLENALAELEFNRVAFGAYGAEEQLSLGSVARLINNFILPRGISTELSIPDGHPYRREIKLCFLALLCIRSSFLKIERLSFAKQDHTFIFQVEGPTTTDENGNPRMEPEWISAREPTANTVQFPLFNIECDTQGYDFVKKQRDDSLSLKLWMKPNWGEK